MFSTDEMEEWEAVDIDEDFLLRTDMNYNSTELDLDLESIRLIDENLVLASIFPNLTHIILNNNQLESLENNSRLFRGLDRLRIINLEYNRLSCLHPNIFANLVRVEEIDLSNNDLKAVDKDLFRICHDEYCVIQPFNQLQHLDLSSNQIETLHPQLFSKLAKLEYLSLANNLLKSLEPPVFHELVSLSFLYLQYNQLSTFNTTLFSNLFELEWISLNNNQITETPKELFANLTLLNKPILHNNPLKSN